MKALIVDALASGKGERKATRDAIGAGPRAVAGILESRGIEASILEAETILTGGFPEGFNLLLTSGMTGDIPAIRRVVSHWKGGPTLIGGPVTSDPEQALRKTGCDIAIVGEGEETLSELLDAGLSGGEMPDEDSLRRIRGLAFNVDDDVEMTQLRRVMPRQTLDGFKPSTSTVRGYVLYRSARVYVETLRGCSNYHRSLIGGDCESCGICRGGGLVERYDCPLGTPPGCGYCSVPSLYGPPKSRSAGRIKDEIVALLEAGVSRVVLSAPCFLDYGRDLLVEPEPLTDPRSPEPNYDEIEKLLSSLAVIPRMRDETAAFMIENLKASLVTDRAARLLGKYLAGTPVSIGFETGSEAHSELMGRPSTPGETLRAIGRLRRAGLKPYVYFIHGLPGQTDETVDATVKAIEGSMNEGAERTILYRFQSLPMSAFSEYPSAPPTIRDSGSRRIHEAAAKANMKAKDVMVGKIIRVVVAERYDRDKRQLVAYPLKHGPVVLIESPQPWEGRVIDVEVTGVASERIVRGKPVAMF
ncbi:MAG: radical SAM protein [Candidatus Bathyarchaeota archaeon]|nr:radical SAM protein [Candidatus Bathyarchaeota archaeon]